MRIGVYRLQRGEIEPAFCSLDINDLLQGKNAKQTMKILGINKTNFRYAFLTTHDTETDLNITVRIDTYERFEALVWYLRVKFLQKQKQMQKQTEQVEQTQTLK